MSVFALPVCGVVLWAIARLEHHVARNKIREKQFRLAIMRAPINVFLVVFLPVPECRTYFKPTELGE